MTPVYCTTEQAVAFFCIPSGTIRRWVHEGKLNRYGPGNRNLYDFSELSELVRLRDRRVNATLSSVGEVWPTSSPDTDKVRGSSMIGDAHGAH